jgi:hypothetical protein
MMKTGSKFGKCVLKVLRGIGDRSSEINSRDDHVPDSFALKSLEQEIVTNRSSCGRGLIGHHITGEFSHQSFLVNQKAVERRRINLCQA